MSRHREHLLQAFLEHRHALLHYLTGKFGNAALAEDLAHDTWLRLASYEPQQHIANPRAYLFRIATNLGLDHLRHVGMGIEVQVDADSTEQVVDEQVDPARSVELCSDLQQLLRLVDELPPRCREVFILCRVEGLSHAEIAERLGISKHTVVAQMVKALARLEKVLP